MNPEIRMNAHIARRSKIAGAPERVTGHIIVAPERLLDCQNERPRRGSVPTVYAAPVPLSVAQSVKLLVFLSIVCWLAVCGAISIAAIAWWLLVGPGLGMLR